MIEQVLKYFCPEELQVICLKKVDEIRMTLPRKLKTFKTNINKYLFGGEKEQGLVESRGLRKPDILGSDSRWRWCARRQPERL